MPHLRLLVGLCLATAAAWFTIDRLATAVGPAAALAVGALVVVAFSAAFHRFWREWAANRSTPPTASPTRLSLSRVFAIGVVAGMAGISALQPVCRQVNPSAGIGSVSAGISDTVLAALVAVAVVGFGFVIHSLSARRGPPGGDSQ